MTHKKYFKTLSEARKAYEDKKQTTHRFIELGIYKMPKGTRHPGMYAVCSHMEFINTY